MGNIIFMVFVLFFYTFAIVGILNLLIGGHNAFVLLTIFFLIVAHISLLVKHILFKMKRSVFCKKCIYSKNNGYNFECMYYFSSGITSQRIRERHATIFNKDNNCRRFSPKSIVKRFLLKLQGL